MDDPFSSLDPLVGRRIFDKLKVWQLSSGKTIILATHQQQFFQDADTLTVLNRGNVVVHGVSKDVRVQVDEWVKEHQVDVNGNNVESDIIENDIKTLEHEKKLSKKISAKNHEILEVKEDEKINKIVQEEKISSKSLTVKDQINYYSVLG